MNLQEIAEFLSERLVHIFMRDNKGHRLVFGVAQKFQADPARRDHIHFYEYLHGDNGAGLGAGHQTGWWAGGETDAATGRRVNYICACG
jgi:hypothetical protein